jgi:DNA-binding GntR family transcriptional regulator
MRESDTRIITPSLEEKQFILERNLLVDRITGLLWDHIVHGRIRPGTRLVERQLADELGISRVPVREALIQLEKEGLIVSRPNGRYVIELSEGKINKLYAVRRVLERLAVELATQNTSPEYANALENKMQEMREAVARQDLSAFTRNDFEIHSSIWRQANNPYLLDVLRTLTGPIYMFIADNAAQFGWEETLELHENLINCINSGNTQAAIDAIGLHMDDGLRRSRQVFSGAGVSNQAYSGTRTAGR